ncbi:MAG: phosphoribosyltransferase, partial [Acidimicrobiales bacterium]
MPYADRFEAGGRLAARLRSLGTVPVGAEAVVLGLPRGGVPVAAAVARDLGAPLDVVLVRKLGVPTQPELAMGAIGEGGVRILDPGVL